MKISQESSFTEWNARVGAARSDIGGFVIGTGSWCVQSNIWRECGSSVSVCEESTNR